MAPIQHIIKTEKGIISKFDKKNSKIKFLCPPIHLLFYKVKKDKLIQVVCLDYGIFAEGHDIDSTRLTMIDLIKNFLKANTKKAIEKTLLSHRMEQFWALYRIEENREFSLEIDLQMFKNSGKSKNNIPNTEKIKNLEEENKALKNKIEESKITDKLLAQVVNRNMNLEKQIHAYSREKTIVNSISKNSRDGEYYIDIGDVRSL